MNDEGVVEITIEPDPPKKNKLIVGVIIPVKYPAFLVECIESILNQDAPSHVQVVPIVVSSASNESFNKIKPYKGRINAILTRRHCEAGSALNLGLKWLRERFPGFKIAVCVSSDDMVSPNFVSSIIEADGGESRPKIYSPGCIHVDESGEVTSKKREDCDPLNLAFNRSAINKLGAWHSNLSYAAGREMALRAKVGKIKVEPISDKIYLKRSHPSQMSKTINTDSFRSEGLIFKACRDSDVIHVSRSIVDRVILKEL